MNLRCLNQKWNTAVKMAGNPESGSVCQCEGRASEWNHRPVPPDGE